MASLQFDYRLGAVAIKTEPSIDLEPSEYTIGFDKGKDETTAIAVIEGAVKYGYGQILINPIDKRTDVQRKADWYVEQQNKKLNKEKDDV